MHEVLKFRFKNSGTRDKVKSFNEATKFWNADSFITKVHRKPLQSNESREGRKLGIAGYVKRMKPKTVSKKRTLNVPPTYTIPSEKKRDNIRFDIRMKMLYSSGMTFKSTADAMDAKKSKKDKMKNQNVT